VLHLAGRATLPPTTGSWETRRGCARGNSTSLLSESPTHTVVVAIAKIQAVTRILLKTASGVSLPNVKYIIASVLIQNMETPVQHDFFVVRDLIAPAVLGLDFIQHQSLVLDFSEQIVHYQWNINS